LNRSGRGARPILIVGSVALDDVTTPKESATAVLGGSASFSSLAACKLAPVQLVAVIGGDFPPHYHRMFEKHPIDLEGLQVKPGRTFRWSGAYSGSRLESRVTLDTQLNVFADFHPDIPAAYQSAPFVLLGAIQPELQMDVLRQAKGRQFVACDTIKLWLDTAREGLTELYRRVDCVLLSDEEVAQFTGEASLTDAARLVLELGPTAVVIKRGELGSRLVTRTMTVDVPAVPVDAVRDPTGAGDAFAGGFLGALAGSERIDEQALRTAMLYGNVFGSLAVEDFSVRRIVEADQQVIDRRFNQLAAMTALEGRSSAEG
jgi:sugar/nucleoside kinase (ribokinase family)